MHQFNPRTNIQLDDGDVYKVEKILEYMMRGTGIELVNLSKANGASFRTPDSHNPLPKEKYYIFDTMKFGELIYFHIVRFFDFGNIEVELGNHSAVIELCYSRYLELISTEESTEEIPVDCWAWRPISKDHEPPF